MSTHLEEPDSVICDMGALCNPHTREGSTTRDEHGDIIDWAWHVAAELSTFQDLRPRVTV
jgi:hypothetical protein